MEHNLQRYYWAGTQDLLENLSLKLQNKYAASAISCIVSSFFCNQYPRVALELLFFICFLKGINAIIGAVAVDMGILTTPQLHWIVRSRNKGTKASDFDYYAQLSKSFGLAWKCLIFMVSLIKKLTFC